MRNPYKRVFRPVLRVFRLIERMLRAAGLHVGAADPFRIPQSVRQKRTHTSKPEGRSGVRETIGVCRTAGPVHMD